MSFSFSWVDFDTKFNSQAVQREDEKIFSLRIRQREGGMATAEIVVKNPKVGLLSLHRKRYGMITYHQELLFRGRLVGMPVQIEGEAVRLLFLAHPADYQAQLKALMATLKQKPYWDELFVAPGHQNNPLEVLEARTALYYCSRTSGRVSVSDLFKGKRHVNLGKGFFYDSLQVRVHEAPLSEIEVELSADWLQQASGNIDITPQLLAHFPYGLISTYSGEDLEAKWWKRGEKIGRTGYWVDSSILQEVSPPSTGVLNLYPKLSSKLWAAPKKKGESPQQVRLKRYWYRFELRLGWQYQQARRESVRFVLNQVTQPILPTSARRRRLHFRLQKIVSLNHKWRPQHRYTPGFRVVCGEKIYRCIHAHRSGHLFESQYWKALGPGQHSDPQSCRSSFFTTDRGREAIAHAIERAKAHLAASARAISIRLQAPFESLCEVTTDHSLTIEDERLPGGRATGKVIAYCLYADGNTGKRWVEVEIGVSVGRQKRERPVVPKSNLCTYYVSEGYLESETPEPLSDIQLGDWTDQLPKQGMHSPQSLRARDMLRHVELINSVNKQERHLWENQYPQALNFSQVLTEVPTDLKIRLADLGTEPRLTHTINIPVLSEYFPPCQIDLESS